MPITTRRLGTTLTSFSLVAGFVAILGGASPAAANEKLAMKLDYLPYGMHAPLYYAVEKGWFRDAGLDLTIEDGNGSAPTVALVGAGKYDIAHVDLSATVMARDKGIPVKAVAGLVRRSDLGVLVADGSGIKTPKDLEGKVAYYSPNSVESFFIDTYFAKAGVDKSKVKLTSVDLSVKVSTYLSGSGDAMFSLVPLYTIDKLPRHSTGLLFADYGIQVPGFGIVANDDAIKEKPKAIAAFVAAFQRAWIAIRYENAADEAVAALIKERPQAKLDPVTMKQQIEAVIEFIDSPATKDKPMLWQAESDWRATLDGLEQVGAISKGSKASDYFTNQFIPATPAK